MESLLGGIFLGWRLGANDAANVMGAAVATRMLRVHAAILLAAAFVVLGAVLEGGAGMHTYAGSPRCPSTRPCWSRLPPPWPSRS